MEEKEEEEEVKEECAIAKQDRRGLFVGKPCLPRVLPFSPNKTSQDLSQ